MHIAGCRAETHIHMKRARACASYAFSENDQRSAASSIYIGNCESVELHDMSPVRKQSSVRTCAHNSRLSPERKMPHARNFLR